MSKNKKEDENKTYRTIQFVVKSGHPLNEYFMDMMYKSITYTMLQIFI